MSRAEPLGKVSLPDTLAAARDCLAANDVDGAEKICNALERSGGRRHEVLGLRGEVELARGQLERAEQFLGEAVRTPEGRSDAGCNHRFAQVLHDLGKLDRAITHYRRALRIGASGAELHRDLGVAYEAKGWMKEAAQSLQEAIKLDPADELAHAYLGRVLRAQGAILPALRQFARAATLKLTRPLRLLRQQAATQSTAGKEDGGLGEARKALEAKRFAEAEAQVRALINADPNNAEALALYARICGKTRRLDEAIHYARHALAADSGNADLHTALGEFLFVADRLEEAATNFEAAVAADPEHAKACANLAFVKQRLDCDADAERLARRALELEPGSAHVNNVCAYVLLAQARFAEAEPYCREALRLDPRSASAYLNLAKSFKERGRLEEARAMIEQGAERISDEATSYTHLAQFEFDLGDMEAAIEHTRRALSLEPAHMDAHMTLSNLLLLSARYEEGWQEYEWRKRYHRQASLHDLFRKRLERFRQWVGQSLEGKSILMHSEQALGEQLLFSQCVPELARRAREVTLLCDGRLESLLSRSFPQVRVLPVPPEQRLGEYQPDRDYDYWCALGSLPGVLKLGAGTIPAAVAYLKPDATRVDRWRQRLAALGPGIKAAISWRGGIVATGRFKRSLDLEVLRPVLEVPGVHWVNMQYTNVAREIAQLRESTGVEITHWQEAIDDFEEHAALAAALDHRISACNTLVHLSGAMGLRTWVLAPPTTIWPYGLGAQMPWYPSVKIYRQQRYKDWSAPLAGVAADLRSLVAAGA